MGRSASAWLQQLARGIPSGAERIAIPQRAIYIVPTKSGLAFFGILLVMLVGALNYQNNLGLFFTFFPLSMVLTALYHSWLNLLGLQVAIQGGPPVFCGERARFFLHLWNPTARTKIALQASAPGAVAPVQGSLPPQSETSLHLWFPTTHRGVLRLGRVRLETRYPLGFFRAWCYLDPAAETLVYPKPAARAPLPHPVPGGQQQAGGDQGRGADDFLGLRPYRPGDSPRRLDWKALSRARGLLVKQFGGERADQVWLDWYRLPPADPEKRLRWLCRQVLDAHQLGQRFGLRLPEQKIPPSQGMAHRNRCLEALARHA